MTDISLVRHLVRSDPVSTETPATLRSIRLRMRELAIHAALGMPSADLAHHLARTWHQATAVSRPRAREAAEMAAEVAIGCCAAARWLEPSRSAQAVPPLSVVVWHVGALRKDDPPAMLWLDVVLPGDVRRAAGQAWAMDMRLLLAEAEIPCRVETVVLPETTAYTAMPEVPRAPTVAVWGCMSLYHHYASLGEHLGARSHLPKPARNKP